MVFQKTYEEALEKARSKPQKPRKPLARGKTLRQGNVGSGSPGRKGTLKATSTAGGKKAKKTKRKKLPSRKRVIAILDSLTSRIVRLRDRVCVQCGTTESLTCGHLLSRRSHATRWDLANCFAQCWPHNFAHGSHSPYPYFRWFIGRYGQESFDALYAKWAKGQKFSTPELREMAEEYKSIHAKMLLSHQADDTA